MIYDVNDDPILQVSGQEPSTSSRSPNYPFSVKSCLILIKLSGYLSCHLTTRSIMLKMIPSSKPPVRNHQHAPSPKLTLSQPNHIRYWSNFQDIPYHLTTWSIMLKLIPSFKSPVRNHQYPPSPKLTLFQPNHIRSWLNFYSSLINQQNFKAILQLSWACCR